MDEGFDHIFGAQRGFRRATATRIFKVHKQKLGIVSVCHQRTNDDPRDVLVQSCYDWEKVQKDEDQVNGTSP